MFKLIKFLIGYVTVTVSGNNPELLINILLRRKITVWHIRRISNTQIKLCMYAEDFKNHIKSAARKSGCLVHINRRRGMHFTIIKYKERKVLVVSCLIAILLIILSGMSVWKIEIDCEDRELAAYAAAELNSMGIKQGSLINRINTKNISQEILLSDSRLKWVNVTKVGTILKVELLLDDEYKKIIHDVPENIPCDIVALKDCTIYKIDVEAGNKIVSAGDTVCAGEILVRGIGYENELNNPDKGYHYDSNDLHARANVLGVINYVCETEIRNTIQIISRTGQTKVFRSLLIFGRKVSLPVFGKKFDSSDSVYYETYPEVFNEDKPLPLGIAVDVEYETELVEVYLDDEKAILYAKMFAQTEMDTMLPQNAVILSTNVNYIEREGIKYIRLEASCLENIGVDLADDL